MSLDTEQPVLSRAKQLGAVVDMRTSRLHSGDEPVWIIPTCQEMIPTEVTAHTAG